MKITLLHCLNLVRLGIRDFDREFLCGKSLNNSTTEETAHEPYLLNRHHNLNGVQAVKAKVVCKRCGRRELRGVKRWIFEIEQNGNVEPWPGLPSQNLSTPQGHASQCGFSGGRRRPNNGHGGQTEKECGQRLKWNETETVLQGGRRTFWWYGRQLE